LAVVAHVILNNPSIKCIYYTLMFLQTAVTLSSVEFLELDSYWLIKCRYEPAENGVGSREMVVWRRDIAETRASKTRKTNGNWGCMTIAFSDKLNDLCVFIIH